MRTRACARMCAHARAHVHALAQPRVVSQHATRAEELEDLKAEIGAELGELPAVTVMSAGVATPSAGRRTAGLPDGGRLRLGPRALGASSDSPGVARMSSLQDPSSKSLRLDTREIGSGGGIRKRGR